MRLIALMFLLASASYAAPATAASSPIRVVRCQINQPVATVTWIDSWGNSYTEPGTTNNVDVDFINNGTQDAVAIEFVVLVKNTLVAEMRNSGKFSPGVVIKHNLGLDSAALKLRTFRCIALRVTWADGSQWKSPELSTITPLNR